MCPPVLQEETKALVYNSLPLLIKVISPGKLETFLENGLITPFSPDVDPGDRTLRVDTLLGLADALRVSDPPEQVTYPLYQAVGRLYRFMPNTMEVTDLLLTYINKS